MAICHINISNKNKGREVSKRERTLLKNGSKVHKPLIFTSPPPLGQPFKNCLKVLFFVQIDIYETYAYPGMIS